MNNKIVFSTTTDTTSNKFLSNSSKYKFVLKGKLWQTVDHYVQAMKFEGTEFEDRIREAATVYEAKKLASSCTEIWEADPRTKKKVKVRGYGRNAQYRIRRNWKELEKEIIEEAIRAKFTQKKALQKKLMATGKRRLVDATNPHTGKILEKLRWEISVKDLNSTSLTGTNRDLIRAILHLSFKVMKMEGWDKIYPEMIEDSIFIFVSRNTAREIIRTYSDYTAKIQKYGNGEGVKKLNNFSRMMNDVEKYIKEKRFPVQIQDRSLILLTSVIGWYTWLEKEDIYTEIDESLQKYRNTEIVLRSGRRWYREKIPPRISSTAQ